LLTGLSSPKADGDGFVVQCLHDEVGYRARNRTRCLKSVLSKRVGDQDWRQAIIMLVGLSNRPRDSIKWFAAQLKNEARSGRLLAGKRENFSEFSIAPPTQIDLLLQGKALQQKHAWR
jgi:hypothetical protein